MPANIVAYFAAKIEGAGSQWGTGGMETKITAARLATASGMRASRA